VATMFSVDWSGYLNEYVKEELVTRETLRNPSDRATKFAIALKPPRPSSEFQIADGVIEDASTVELHDVVMGNVRKHASELRWNCIETMLRADVEANRLDVKRMHDWLVANLDDQQREWLAVQLMQGVKAVPR